MRPSQRPKVLDRDRGWKALVAMADTLARDKPRVAVGVVGQRAVAGHRHGRGQTVVEIAVKHEQGIGTPKRAFIGPTIDENRQRYRELIKQQFKSTVLYHARTGAPWRAEASVALKRLGLMVSGDVKKRISAGIAPPLSPYTLKRKGKRKTTPLIDSGQLFSSIAHQIEART